MVFRFHCLDVALNSWLNVWVMKNHLPRTLNIVCNECVPTATLANLIKSWLRLNPSSPTDHTGCVKVFNRFKVPMDLFPALPIIQLQFGQSCTLPCVKADRYGLLGAKEDIILTNYTYGSKPLHKAVMMDSIAGSIHYYNDISNLNFVTQFDAVDCRMHSGHLEQLALACPNLQYLDLQWNFNCLQSLQGLHVIAACCRSLRGLNLLGISIKAVESRVKVWEILASLRLTCLVVELCVLVPNEEDEQTKQLVFNLYKKCSSLMLLEVHCCTYCAICRFTGGESGDLILLTLSNFPSLVRCSLSNIHVAVGDIVNSCAKLK